MANYGMIVGSMASQDVKSKNRAGLVTGIAANVNIPNGALVFADNTSPAPTNIYGGAEITLENFKQYAGASDGAAYVLDAAEIPEVTDVNGNTYKVGSILSNLEFAYNKALRYRKLEVEDRLYIFDGNITGTAVVNQYLVPTVSSFNFTPSQTLAASGLCLRVEATFALNNGLSNVGNKYFCKVVQL